MILGGSTLKCCTNRFDHEECANNTVSIQIKLIFEICIVWHVIILDNSILIILYTSHMMLAHSYIYIYIDWWLEMQFCFGEEKQK